MRNIDTILKVIRKYGGFSFFIFSISFVLGILITVIYPSQAEDIFSEVLKGFAPFLELGPLEMIIFIFLNNTIKVFLAMLLGVFIALPTLFFLFINGMTLGVISSLFYSEIGFLTILFMLLPHGIFELPALFIGSGFGIWLGTLFWQKIRKKRFRDFLYGEDFKEPLKICMDVFFLIIVPLLGIAAIIETALIFL